MENNKKILVVFYSRTGVTRKIAQELAAGLGADIEEIHDKKNRSGAMGYITASIDAVTRKCTEIENCVKKPSEYDLVIIGTPIWGSTMCSAVRTYLKLYKENIKTAGFLITYKMFGVPNVVRNMEMILDKKPVSVIDFKSGSTTKEQLAFKIENLKKELLT
ncbi:hypothetical protein KAJ27_08160 [bacterium]|nr:hypothetical protein [bacterium]